MYQSVLDDLFELNREMNRIFNGTGYRGYGAWPETNMYEDTESYVLVSKVPGMSREDIEVSIQDNTLSISGSRKKDQQENMKMHLNERFQGDFQRNFLLNERIDTDRIKAETENGLLIIRLPKSPESKPKKIEIQ